MSLQRSGANLDLSVRVDGRVDRLAQISARESHDPFVPDHDLPVRVAGAGWARDEMTWGTGEGDFVLARRRRVVRRFDGMNTPSFRQRIWNNLGATLPVSMQEWVCRDLTGPGANRSWLIGRGVDGRLVHSMGAVLAVVTFVASAATALAAAWMAGPGHLVDRSHSRGRPRFHDVARVVLRTHPRTRLRHPCRPGCPGVPDSLGGAVVTSAHVPRGVAEDWAARA